MFRRLFSSLFWVFLTSFAQADSIEDIVSIEVLSGWRTGETTHMAGLQITLAEGWKTYWRVPGEGGIPPRFDWSRSENLASATFHWPVPHVFYSGDLRSIGYDGSVTIPVEFMLEHPEDDARIAGSVQLGICDDICVPVLLDFDGLLPTVGQRDPAIIAALLDGAQTAQEAGIRDVTCDIEPLNNGLRVIAEIKLPVGLHNSEVIIETANQEIWVSPPSTRQEGNTLFVQSDLLHVQNKFFLIDLSLLRITLLHNGTAIDIQGCHRG